MKAAELKVSEKILDKKDIFLAKQDKIDLIKWMFGFWITIIVLLLANWFLK